MTTSTNGIGNSLEIWQVTQCSPGDQVHEVHQLVTGKFHGDGKDKEMGHRVPCALALHRIRSQIRLQLVHRRRRHCGDTLGCRNRTRFEGSNGECTQTLRSMRWSRWCRKRRAYILTFIRYDFQPITVIAEPLQRSGIKRGIAQNRFIGDIIRIHEHHRTDSVSEYDTDPIQPDPDRQHIVDTESMDKQ